MTGHARHIARDERFIGAEEPLMLGAAADIRDQAAVMARVAFGIAGHAPDIAGEEPDIAGEEPDMAADAPDILDHEKRLDD